jgi:hypothetical protein
MPERISIDPQDVSPACPLLSARGRGPRGVHCEQRAEPQGDGRLALCRILSCASGWGRARRLQKVQR